MYNPNETRQDLRDAVNGIQGIENINKKQNDFNDLIQKFRGETDEQRREAVARAYANNAPSGLGKSTIPLITRDDIRKSETRFTYTPRGLDKKMSQKVERNFNFNKIIVSVALVGALVGSAAAINYINDMQNKSMEEGQQIVSVEPVPFADDYNLMIRQNGSAFYQNSNGDQVDSINGVFADEYATSIGYDVPENAKKSNIAK